MWHLFSKDVNYFENTSLKVMCVHVCDLKNKIPTQQHYI